MRAAAAGWLTVLGALAIAGCAQNPYALQSQLTAVQQQQAALAQRNQELQSRASSLDQDNQDLQTQLAQTQRQSHLLQDQVSAMREQLGSTTSQLAQARQDKQLVERNAQAMVASTKRRAGALITPNNSLTQSLPNLSLPGLQVRQDGDTVRFELSSDRLFVPGTAQLRPDAPATDRRRRGGYRADLSRANHRRRGAYRQRPSPRAAMDVVATILDGHGHLGVRLSHSPHPSPADPALSGRARGQSPGGEQRHRRRQSPQPSRRAGDLSRQVRAIAPNGRLGRAVLRRCQRGSPEPSHDVARLSRAVEPHARGLPKSSASL